MIDGFIKCAAATPEVRVADCDFNTQDIIEQIRAAEQAKVKVLVFPELCVTGYTCGDLFFQSTLINAAQKSLGDILTASDSLDMIIMVGCPLDFFGKLYNCAVVMQYGKILGIIPKSTCLTTTSSTSSAGLHLRPPIKPRSRFSDIRCRSGQALSSGAPICPNSAFPPRFARTCGVPRPPAPTRLLRGRLLSQISPLPMSLSARTSTVCRLPMGNPRALSAVISSPARERASPPPT